MNVDPRQARAALSRYVPSRITRLVTNYGDAVSPQKPPGNLKSAQRNMKRFRQQPQVCWTAAYDRGGGRIMTAVCRRGLHTLAVPDPNGNIYQTECLNYIFHCTTFRRGQVDSKAAPFAAFTPHAIQRWAERAEHLDLKWSDKKLLTMLDKEAILFLTGGQTFGWPVISHGKQGLWIGQPSEDIHRKDIGVLVSTFLPADTLTGNKLLYFHGLGQFEDLSDLIRVHERDEELVEKLKARQRED